MSYTWRARTEEAEWSEDPDRNGRVEKESGRKEREEWVGLEWPECKWATGAQILGQGIEKEAIDAGPVITGNGGRLLQEMWDERWEMKDGGFVREEGRWNQCWESRTALWGRYLQCLQLQVGLWPCNCGPDYLFGCLFLHAAVAALTYCLLVQLYPLPRFSLNLYIYICLYNFIIFSLIIYKNKQITYLKVYSFK